MFPIDERLKPLGIVLPDVMPPVVADMSPVQKRLFVPVITFICPAALARRMAGFFAGRWAMRLAWSKASSPHVVWQLNCWLCSKPLWAILIASEES